MHLLKTNVKHLFEFKDKGTLYRLYSDQKYYNIVIVLTMSNFIVFITIESMYNTACVAGAVPQTPSYIFH